LWKLDYDDNHIDVIWPGDNHPKCRFCNVQLVGHHLKKMHIKDLPGYDGHALDIECICPECGLLQVFGIAISETDFNNIKCMELPC
jgi:hypothetical protein